MAAIGLVVLVAEGTIPEGTFLALLILALAGAVFPPIVVPVAAVVLLVVLLKGDVGGKVFGWLDNLSKAKAGPSEPSKPLGPEAYLPSKTVGSA